MKKYKIISANMQLEESVKQVMGEGYLPIGRSFFLNRVHYQTVVHNSVLKNLKTFREKNGDKYIVVGSATEAGLEEVVNNKIENGFIPTGRMYFDTIEYKQTLIHASTFNDLETFWQKAVMEG